MVHELRSIDKNFDEWKRRDSRVRTPIPSIQEAASIFIRPFLLLKKKRERENRDIDTAIKVKAVPGWLLMSEK